MYGYTTYTAGNSRLKCLQIKPEAKVRKRAATGSTTATPPPPPGIDPGAAHPALLPRPDPLPPAGGPGLPPPAENMHRFNR